jgi:peptidylprolyl isomerase
MELLSAMPRGPAPMGFYTDTSQRVKIQSMRLAADMSRAERRKIEVLRTDSPTFAKLIEAKRNRRDAFYTVPAGKIDLCSIGIPSREAK